jgi:DNA-binding NtrC family response regulator
MAKISPTLNVLIVDDESLIRWSLAETLEEAGHRVFEAGDRASALQVISQTAQPFDVIVLDFRLPDSNDLNLLATIRKRTPSTAVIMMTAYGSDMLGGALDLGVHCVVTKPFEVHEMSNLVLQAHAGRRTS